MLLLAGHLAGTLLSLRGRTSRASFWRICAVLIALQAPLMVVLMAATRNQGVFAILLDISLLLELILLLVLFSAMTRRVRDAGGNPSIPLGIVLSAGLLLGGRLSAAYGLGWTDLEPPGALSSLAFWSFSGFLVCLLFLLVLPGFDEDVQVDWFQRGRADHGTAHEKGERSRSTHLTAGEDGIVFRTRRL